MIDAQAQYKPYKAMGSKLESTQPEAVAQRTNAYATLYKALQEASEAYDAWEEAEAMVGALELDVMKSQRIEPLKQQPGERWIPERERWEAKDRAEKEASVANARWLLPSLSAQLKENTEYHSLLHSQVSGPPAKIETPENRTQRLTDEVDVARARVEQARASDPPCQLVKYQKRLEAAQFLLKAASQTTPSTKHGQILRDRARHAQFELIDLRWLLEKRREFLRKFPTHNAFENSYAQSIQPGTPTIYRYLINAVKLATIENNDATGKLNSYKAAKEAAKEAATQAAAEADATQAAAEAAAEQAAAEAAAEQAAAEAALGSTQSAPS
jgi:hypothetical protein